VSEILLAGIVGSTAYGLAREGSDLDYLGVYVDDTVDRIGLMSPKDTLHEEDLKPDITLHEVGKYLGLALKANPTILELLWLPDYLVKHRHGQGLIDIRYDLLSEPTVRSAYGGYAMAQVERLKRRHAEGKDGFSSDTQKRTAKHARHCFRLLRQGRELLETWDIPIKVWDPEFYWGFDNATVDEIVERFQEEFRVFNSCQSQLPPKPSYNVVDAWLKILRLEHLLVTPERD
jgi:predicted nucleotidyltransferase